jgi:hypothetical protein
MGRARNALEARAAELYDSRLSWAVRDCGSDEAVELEEVRDRAEYLLRNEIAAEAECGGPQPLIDAAARTAIGKVAKGIEEQHEDSLAEGATYRINGVLRVARNKLRPTVKATEDDILDRRSLRESNVAEINAANARERAGEDKIIAELRALPGRATIGQARPHMFEKQPEPVA